MQLKILKRLNLILYALLGAVLILAIVVILNFNFFRPHLLLVFAGTFIYNMIAFFLYKYLEKNWDKSIIQKMAIANQVVIANIKQSKQLFSFKDSGGKRYNMWQIELEYVDHDLNHHTTLIFEKLNQELTILPLGTVFLTYDPKKPDRQFIVPNVIISHIDTMIPIVSNYEKSKKAFIKYLNVYYNDGLIIETYRQSMSKQA